MSPLPTGMTPSQVGERAEAAVLAALACTGKQVLVPFGGQHRYDLAYEDQGRLVKVQCKSGREANGAIFFRTHSEGRGRTGDYRGDADCFGVYCHDRGEVYIVPVADVPPSAAHLRLDPPRNGQQARVRWASQYRISPAGPSDQLILTDVDVCATMPSVTTTQLPLAPSEAPIACCAPLSGATISVDEADAAATLFKALADPHRVLILNRLLSSDDAVCVCELNEDLDLAQPTVSFHLKKLVNAGILAREQRGTWAYFSVVPAAMEQLSQLFKIKENV